MIPVMCNCANNLNGVCYGKVNTVNIENVMDNTVLVENCPGYAGPNETPYEGVVQGDRKMGPNGQVTYINEGTPAQFVAADKAMLVLTFGEGDTVDSVTKALATLPFIGRERSSIISFVSDKPSVVSNNGQVVVRPAHGDGDETVTLTATITNATASDTKEFVLTVKEEEA